MKLYIIGHGRHGKDQLAQYIGEHAGLTWCSSSLFMAERVVLPYFKKHTGVRFDSPEHCFENRSFFRPIWKEAIKEFNEQSGDLATLSREIFAENDIYVGIRSREEFLCAKETLPFETRSIWVDRPGYSTEPTLSITMDDCDYWVPNDGSLEDLREQAHMIADTILNPELPETD